MTLEQAVGYMLGEGFQTNQSTAISHSIDTDNLFLFQPLPIRHMQQPHTIPLSPLATSIVACGRIRVAMAHQALDRREIDAGIEEVATKRPPQVVG